jgi:hypothetical protein
MCDTAVNVAEPADTTLNEQHVFIYEGLDNNIINDAKDCTAFVWKPH